MVSLTNYMIKLLLFKAHQGDPISRVISAVTRSQYTHAAILKDEATNTISEAWFPHVRERRLDNSELHGIDVFNISTTFPEYTPLTAAQNEAILSRCEEREKIHEDYSISNLFRFIPGLEDLIGKARDTGPQADVFCSQYAFDVISLLLLNAPSSELAPGYLGWSPLLFPCAPLAFLPSTGKAPPVAT